MSIVTITFTLLTFLLAIGAVNSFTPEEEAVFEKAEKSLAAQENKSSIGSNFVQTANKTGIGGLTLSNSYSYYDTLGYFYVTAEVINRSPDAMQNIAAYVGFYDLKRNIIDTNLAYAYPAVVNSGDKGAFMVQGPDPTQVKKVCSFKITLDGD